MAKKILLVLLIILVVIQFIRPTPNSGTAYGATDYTKVLTVPPLQKSIIEKACMDCHSNHTTYPWYSQVAPVSFWLNHHIEEGKRELNFSEFATYPAKKQAHKLEEVADQVQRGEMPLKSYTWIHTDAKLNESEKQALVQWAKTESSKAAARQ